MDETGSGSCPVAGSGISGVESSVFVAILLGSFRRNRGSVTSHLLWFFTSVMMNAFTVDSA